MVDIDWLSEKVSCPICKGEDFGVLSNRVRYNVPCQIVRCKHCEFIYMNPRPSESDLKKYYSREYRLQYDGHCYPPESYLISAYKDAVERIKFLTDNVKLDGEKKLLDIGCSEGSFPYLLKKKIPYLIVTGIDPHEGYTTYARETLGINDIVTSVFETYSFACNFDVITMFHVLEHMYNPDKVLSKINDILTNDGILYLIVPNTEFILFDFPFKKDEFLHDYFQPAHLWYFTPTSLNKLLQKYGFQVIKITTALTISIPILSSLQDLLGSGKKSGGKKIYEQTVEEKTIELLNIISSVLNKIICIPLNKISKGREIHVLAQRR